jgi:hypothetical protein
MLQSVNLILSQQLTAAEMVKELVAIHVGCFPGAEPLAPIVFPVRFARGGL